MEPAATTLHGGIGGGGRENLKTGRQASGAQGVQPAAAARLGELSAAFAFGRTGGGTGDGGATRWSWRRRSYPGAAAAPQIDPSPLLPLHGISLTREY